MHGVETRRLPTSVGASTLGLLIRRWAAADPYRPLPRAVAIAARTAHLLAMAGYLGRRMTGSSGGLRTWRTATTVTGAVLLATEASHSRQWAVEGRGLLVLAHTGVLVVGHRARRLGTPVAVIALVIGAVGSHLPRSVRKWSLLDGAPVDDRARRGSTGPSDEMHARRLERRHDRRPLDETQLLG